MKKYLSNILVSAFLLTILVGVGGSAFPQTVHAQIDWSKKPWEVGSGIISAVVAPVSLLILKITSLLTMLSGGILNFVVDHTIVKMAANYKEISAISGAWGTVRDVANMGFIFILLYASIQMILGEGKDTRKLIVNIIIAALLINFSMFFTQVVIDAANIIALTFYHAIAPTAVTGNLLDAGLSNSLMAPLHLNTIWNMRSTLTNGSMAVIGIMGSVITLIAAFIFFAVALMLVIRYVVLILVLILSPIAFLGDVIPGASGYAKDWRKALFGQAFFAPVYMFLTWITIKMFNDPKMFPTSAGESWAEAFGGEVTTNTANVAFSDSSVGLAFNFVVIIVFLIATLIISKKVSDSAGQGINKLTSKALGYAGGATLGMAGYAGRRTIGAASTAVANSEWLKNKEKQGGASGMMARLSLKSGQKLAKQSFDVRGTALGGALDAGKAGGKGGYEQMVKDQAKAKEEFAKSLAPSDIVVDQAKQELERAKEINENDSKFKSELLEEQGRRRQATNDMEKKLYDAQSRTGDFTAMPEEIAQLERNLAEAKQKELSAKNAASFKEEKKRAAQASVDKLVGVDEKEAMKRVRDARPSEKLSDDEAKAIVKKENLVQKSEGEIRKQASAIRISNPATISPDRVMFVGKVKRSSLQAAATIRKDKKPVKEQLEAILKEAGDIKGTEEPKAEEKSSEPKTTT